MYLGSVNRAFWGDILQPVLRDGPIRMYFYSALLRQDGRQVSCWCLLYHFQKQKCGEGACSQLLGQTPRLSITSSPHPIPEEENLYISPAYSVFISVPWSCLSKHFSTQNAWSITKMLLWRKQNLNHEILMLGFQKECWGRYRFGFSREIPRNTLPTGLPSSPHYTPPKSHSPPVV